MDGIELVEKADRLIAAADDFEAKDFHKDLKSLRSAADRIGKSWSGSSFGYQSLVYYKDFVQPPLGARFSIEWGLMETFSDYTLGDWVEYAWDDAIDAIQHYAGNRDLSEAKSSARKLSQQVEELRHEIASVISLALANKDDSYISALKKDAEKLKDFQAAEFASAMVRTGQVVSRDMRALSGGARAAPHQGIIGEIQAIEYVETRARKMADIAKRLGSHLARLAHKEKKSELIGTNVFIGHGRSHDWRLLKDFVKDRLSLPHDEFNRVPVAGVTNIARLAEMLDSAAIALLVLTAEDEQADKKLHARMNVIHEVGLFQGRLGFTRAIVLLEEGCEEFSNIQGLGQIRFPKGNIAAAFEEVRWVLEREGLIDE